MVQGPDDPELPDADPESVARTILLRKLTAAPATRAQLAALLARKGVPDDVAARVLDRYEEVGLVDDAVYAQLWVRSRQAGRGLSRRALRHELHAKGVSDEVVAAALEEVDGEDERAAAEALVRRKLSSLRGVDAAARTRRLMGMLARKGYSSGMAAAVVREVLRDDEVEAMLAGSGE